jgi:glycosyltransferase involved in cell wall biosynthesis
MENLLSLIICSRNKHLPDDFISNIEQSIGCSYELVVIDNSDDNYSIFEAYQKGFEESKGSYIAYIHDDIKFHTQNWGNLLIEQLSREGTGICGIGGRDTLVRVPCSWKVSLPYIHLVQSDKNGMNRKAKHRPNGYKELSAPVIMLDGVFLSMTREVMEKIYFDTSLHGFHGYDFDSCIRSTLAGYQNYVIYNIDIEHFSRGNADIYYYRNLIEVFKKQSDKLPLCVEIMDKSLQAKLEKRGLKRLTRKMAAKGFSNDEIIDTFYYFNEITASFNSTVTVFFKLYLLYIKIQSSVIRLLFKRS